MPTTHNYCDRCGQETQWLLRFTRLPIEHLDQPRHIAPVLITECLRCGWEVYRVLEQGEQRRETAWRP